MGERVVLVAVDASQNARRAFQWYMDNILHPGDTVILCHIPEPPQLKSLSLKHGIHLPVEEWQKSIQEQIERVNKLENEYSAELISKKIRYKSYTQTDKNPGQGIIKASEAESACMIVMGTRGLDAIRRTLLGSVSDYVVRHSAVPVIICPKND